MSGINGCAAARPDLERLVEIAYGAGREILRHYDGGEAFTAKADGSPLTAADRAAHDLILRELERWDHRVPVVSEEGLVPAYDVRAGWERFWLVDPLDGTKEFLARNGEFTVNIALVEGCEPVWGVILAPALGTAYFAARGFGAWCRHDDGPTTRIVGTDPSPDVTRVVESRSHPSPEAESFIAALGPVVRTRLGSSLKFCRIAEGAADLYPRFGRTMEWDVAAGDCIYRNAAGGGRQRRSNLAYNQPSMTIPGFIVGQAARWDGRVGLQQV